MKKIGIIALLILPLLALLLVFGTNNAHAANKAWLGIYMQDVTKDLAEAFDLKTTKGVLVDDVYDDSPADEAGIRSGDVVLEFNSEKISSSSLLSDLVKSSDIGEEISLLILRNGKEQVITVELGEQKSRKYIRNYGNHHDFDFDFDFDFDDNLHNIFIAKRNGIGVSLQSLSEQLGDYFGVSEGEGALVTEVMEDSPAEDAGIKAGDVIIEVDGDEIENPSDVSSIIGDFKKGEKVDVVVLRNKSEQKFAVEVDELENYGLGDFDIQMFMDDNIILNSPRSLKAPKAPRMYWHGTDLRGSEKKYQEAMEVYEDKMKAMEKRLLEIEKKLD